MDKFDEMAVRMLGIDRRPPDELLGDGDDHGTMSVRELAAALRETDRRAREEERERCARVVETGCPPEWEERSLWLYRAAVAIRSMEPEAGGEACVHPSADGNDSGRFVCTICGTDVGSVSIPACRGGDDAD